jgi:hypothetical protein
LRSGIEHQGIGRIPLTVRRYPDLEDVAFMHADLPKRPAVGKGVVEIDDARWSGKSEIAASRGRDQVD